MSNTITNTAGYQVPATIDPARLVDYIIEFEGGELDDDGVIALFQYLVDTGQAWTLQGSYGRAARSLIEGGYVYAANDLNRPNVIEGQEVIEVPALSAGE